MEDRDASYAINATSEIVDPPKTHSNFQKAMRDPSVANLCYGESIFGPPGFLLPEILDKDLSLTAFLDASRRYEESRGSSRLREAIADWYSSRYGLDVDPETELLVTNGGAEAITLALLATSAPGETIGITDPSYALYAKTIATLGRVAKKFNRLPGTNEYLSLFKRDDALTGTRAIVINSPENPTGYVLSDADWLRVNEVAAASRSWVIHDEVYDVLTFSRPHRPFRSMEKAPDRSVLVNSFSKNFGLPGLRIGWLCGPPRLITLAMKYHDYLFYGVNIQSESIAARILSDPRVPSWHGDIVNMLRDRRDLATKRLTAEYGFDWPRQPLGATFLFPDVSRLHDRLPDHYRDAGPPGDAVARYLMEVRKVAVMPGSSYSANSENYIRMVTYGPEAVFADALDRLCLSL